MSTEPQTLTYPTVTPDALSADARHLYGLAAAKHDGFIKFDADPFDAMFGRRYVPHGTKWEMSERVTTALAEIKATHLGWTQQEDTILKAERLHPLYTVAHGDGDWLAKVRLRPVQTGGFIGSHRTDGVLLATLVGATLDSRDDQHGHTPTMHVTTASKTVRSGGSLVKTAMLELILPKIEMSDWGAHHVTGTLIDARLYPLHVNPIETDDDGEPCAEDEYPPQIEHAALRMPQLVSIDFYAIRAPFTAEGA